MTFPVVLDYRFDAKIAYSIYAPENNNKNKKTDSLLIANVPNRSYVETIYLEGEMTHPESKCNETRLLSCHHNQPYHNVCIV